MAAGSWHARRMVTATDDGRPIAIVDLDGVVADVRHRVHYLQTRPKAWDQFFAAADADPAHPEGLAVVARLADDHEIVFVTGRPDQLRDGTVAWLETHGSPRTGW
jgi:uncharacterized HAD superfamily protein